MGRVILHLLQPWNLAKFSRHGLALAPLAKDAGRLPTSGSRSRSWESPKNRLSFPGNLPARAHLLHPWFLLRAPSFAIPKNIPGYALVFRGINRLSTYGLEIEWKIAQ